MMEEIESLKFSAIEDNILLMLSKLSKNQNFLRYTQYLSDFPLQTEYYDSSANTIQQPDIITDEISMIANKTVFLTLFNDTIITEQKIYMFFSPLKGRNQEGQPLFTNTYVLDFIIPYVNMVMNGTQLRMFRIANEICKAWDNKYIAGLGKVIMYNWATAPVNAVYQGMQLYFKVDDSAFTDEIEE